MLDAFDAQQSTATQPRLSNAVALRSLPKGLFTLAMKDSTDIETATTAMRSTEYVIACDLAGG